MSIVVSSTAFSISRDEIISEALDICLAEAEGETPSAAAIAGAARKLNLMVKAWMAHGLHLWAMEEATLFLSPGTQSYSLGATGTNCTASYVQTTLSTDEATSSTSIGLTSSSGMSASGYIGIVLDDGTTHWTTISGAPGATTTIASGLPSAASAGNVVFSYATKISRPQRIVSMYRRDINGNDTPIHLIARDDYVERSSKGTRGKTVEAFYDPQLTNGVLYTWPAADLATDVIRFWHERPLEAFTTGTSGPDFPIEWGEALVYGLADRLAPGYGVPLAKHQMIEAKAKIKLAQAAEFDRETASVSFSPDFR